MAILTLGTRLGLSGELAVTLSALPWGEKMIKFVGPNCVAASIFWSPGLVTNNGGWATARTPMLNVCVAVWPAGSTATTVMMFVPKVYGCGGIVRVRVAPEPETVIDWKSNGSPDAVTWTLTPGWLSPITI